MNKKKRLWPWILCGISLVCLLACILLIRAKNTDPAPTVLTEETAVSEDSRSGVPASAAEGAPSEEREAEKGSASENGRGDEKNVSAGGDAKDTSELPEVEIPIDGADAKQADEAKGGTPETARKTGDAPEPGEQPGTEPAGQDIEIQDNGDILLPEAP